MIVEIPLLAAAAAARDAAGVSPAAPERHRLAKASARLAEIEEGAARASGRIAELDERIERFDGDEGAAAVAGTILAGEDVGSIAALREERRLLAKGLPEIERQQRAVASAVAHEREAAVKAAGRAAAPVVAALERDLAEAGARIVAIFAAARALESAASVPGAERLATKIHAAIPALRSAKAVTGDRAAVPPLVAEALSPVADMLPALGRAVPESVLVPMNPPTRI